MTTRKQDLSNQEFGSVSRRAFIIRGLLGTLGFAYFPFSFAEIPIVQQARRRKWTRDEVIEKLKNLFWEALEPDPDWDDITEGICKVAPSFCGRIPKDPADVYKFNNLYSFPYRLPDESSFSAVFYNRANRRVVIIPPLVLDGIQKATEYLRREYSLSEIVKWLIPQNHSSTYQRFETKGDYYVYGSMDGKVEMKCEGITDSGFLVNVTVTVKREIIDENNPLKFPPSYRNEVVLNRRFLVDFPANVE